MITPGKKCDAVRFGVLLPLHSPVFMPSLLKSNIPQTPHDSLFLPPLQDFPAIAVSVELSLCFQWGIKAADDFLPPTIAVLNGKVPL